MSGNCWLWARLEYRRRKREWKLWGMPKGQEPYLVKRPSRREPRWIDHYLVGTHDPEVDAVRVVSYKPEIETDEPWWKAWRHAWFGGKIASGDTHRGDL